MTASKEQLHVMLQCGPTWVSFSVEEMWTLFKFASEYGWVAPWDKRMLNVEAHHSIEIQREDAMKFANALARGRKDNNDTELAEKWFGQRGWSQRLLGLISVVQGNSMLMQVKGPD